MRILLDTCTFVWLCAEPRRLSARARTAMQDAEFLLSYASVLEIAMKWQAGKIGLPAPPRLWVREQMEAWSVAPAEMELDDIYLASELAGIHRDPFDRLIVASAINRNVPIVTPDEWIRRYPVGTVW